MTTPEGVVERSGSCRRLVDATVDNNLLVALILVLAIFLLVIARALLGVDSWLTFLSGREIVQHGLPHREALTTIPLGRSWTDQQWLAQLVFYGLERAGGLGLALVFHTLMVTSAIAITVITSRIRGASARMTLLAAVVCLVVAPWSWQLRAQSIGFPLFALTLGLIATDERLARRRTYLVFPILVLWANIHGAVVLGATLVSLAGFLALTRGLRPPVRAGGLRWRGRQGVGAPPWPALVFLLAPWACVLVSPYGTDLVAYYRLLFVDSPVSRYITEWQSPKPHGQFLTFFVVGAATALIAVWQRRRLSLFDLIVLALTLAGALRSVRAVVWFSMAMAMLLPLALDGIVPPRPSSPVHRRVALGLIGSLGALLATMTIFTLTRSDASLERNWSVGAARAAAIAARHSGVRAAVWSSGTYADWLLWKEPALRGRVAWDVRFELLTEPEVRSIVRFNRHRAGWRGTLVGYPVLVLDRRRDAAQVRDLRAVPGLHVGFADGGSVVVTRAAAER